MIELVYFSLVVILSFLLIVMFLFFIYSSMLLRCESNINSCSSFYLPIYQEIKLLFSSYWFKGQINLIEVLFGFNLSLSGINSIFISSMQLINFVLVLMLVSLLQYR